LLAPYISQQLPILSDDVQKNITNFVHEITKNTSSDGKKDLIDELKHLVSHYAKKKNIGHAVTTCVLDGLTKTLGEPGSKSVSFNDIYQVRQAYWAHQEPYNPDKHRMHRTIRINGMPFAEGVLVYLMEHYAHQYAINLEIIDIPWRDVGAALLTNKIDVAFYNETITKQMESLHRLMDNRLLFRSDKAFTYKKYYFLSKTANPVEPDLASMNEPNIAVVSNSDYVDVLANWCEKKLGENKWNEAFQRVMVPVRSPDEAFRMVVDGEVTYCIAGGIHAQYAKQAFPQLFNTPHEITNINIETDVFFWTASSRADNCKKTLSDMISLWIQVKNEWLTIKNGQDADNKRLRSHCVTYVNRQPNEAFVICTTKAECDDLFTTNLASLISNHDEFHVPKAGGFEHITIAGQ
jgi:hypothetical protein